MKIFLGEGRGNTTLLFAILAKSSKVIFGQMKNIRAIFFAHLKLFLSHTVMFCIHASSCEPWHIVAAMITFNLLHYYMLWINTVTRRQVNYKRFGIGLKAATT